MSRVMIIIYKYFSDYFLIIFLSSTFILITIMPGQLIVWFKVTHFNVKSSYILCFITFSFTFKRDESWNLIKVTSFRIIFVMLLLQGETFWLDRFYSTFCLQYIYSFSSLQFDLRDHKKFKCIDPKYIWTSFKSHLILWTLLPRFLAVFTVLQISWTTLNLLKKTDLV